MANDKAIFELYKISPKYKEGEVVDLEFIDEGEFTESGTNVKTIMVTYINK